MQFSMI